MSSKRGRKRNDNLPPNRARDVQRAFRARRAAHLQALEQRVAELEEENGCLRVALNLPPANRPPLGKGPTGKDRPRDATSNNSAALDSPGHSSEPASPSSTRNGSRSPSTINVHPPPRVVGGTPWEQSLLPRGQEVEPHMSTAQSYLPPEHAPMAQKNSQQYTYPSPAPSGPRGSTSSSLYIATQPPNYGHATDRPIGGPFSANFPLRDGRNESTPHYPYSHAPFPAHHDSSVNTQAPPANPSAREMDSMFPHRRSLTEPQAFRPVGHYPTLPALTQPMRRPSPPRQHDNNFPSRPPSSSYGNQGGRLA